MTPDAGNLPHVAYGLAALHGRLVMRGNILLTDSRFVQATRAVQREWNGRYSRYQLPAELDSEGLPVALARDYRHGIVEFEEAEREYETDDPGGSAKDQYEAMIEGIERRAHQPVLRAHDDWHDAVLRLAETFYPPEDFFVPSDADSHPAFRFLARAVASARPINLKDGVDDLIDDVRLGVQDVTWSEEAPMLALGLYPGVTADDIRARATEIVDQVNAMYAERLPLVRMREYLAQGLKYREIGERLGLDKRNVGDALRSIKKASTKTRQHTET